MNIYTKEGMIFYVQVDHLCGEVLGKVIDYLYDAGACNVQVIPSITKKNRPGHVFLIDCRPDHADAVESVIARELTSGGWHRIDTQHRHLSQKVIRRNLQIELPGKTEMFTALYKQTGDGPPRPEFESCAQLKEVLEQDQISISLNQTYCLLGEYANGSNNKISWGKTE